MYSSSLNLTATATLTSQVQTTFSSRNYFGFDFTNLNNLNYLSPIPTVLSTTGSNVDFYLGDVSQDAGADFPTSTTAYSGSLTTALNANTFTSNVSVNTRKFMVPMQGGFDGARPNLPKLSGTNIKSTNTFGFDCSGTATTGTKAYNKAFALLSNADYYDMNMLITPGVIDSIHPLVTSAARNLVEQRQDTFYIMDSNVLTDNIATVVQQVTNIDSNYAATYFPWVRVVDPGKNKPIFVPPSVVMPGVLAFNDAVTAPWYAPAGLTRGGLTTAIGTYKNLSQSNRDTLYENRVNPIANFPNEGICVWGQKTLQARPSALDRVNVRRLLIEVKKFIASSTRYLVFEQNTSATRNRFLSIVNPYLEQVRAQQGLSAFRVVMDETNNTPDVIDRNIMYGQIFLQPTRTAEFIVLDFNIQPTGASFPE
jgi:phage tail sheath protein FI